jgi:hypothetical protein
MLYLCTGYWQQLKLPSTFQVDRRYTLDYLILCVSYWHLKKNILCRGTLQTTLFCSFYDILTSVLLKTQIYMYMSYTFCWSVCVSYQERLTANHSGFLFWSVPSFLHAKDPFYKFWKKSRLILAATNMLFYIFPIYLSILLQWQSKIVTSFIPLHLYYLSLQYNTIYWQESLNIDGQQFTNIN